MEKTLQFFVSFFRKCRKRVYSYTKYRISSNVCRFFNKKDKGLDTLKDKINYIPEIRLAKYFSDPFKDWIEEQINPYLNSSNTNELEQNEFMHIIYALELYFNINGIVNRDTIKSEMLLLDKIIKESKKYTENSKDSDKVSFLKEIINGINTNLSGNLDKDVSNINHFMGAFGDAKLENISGRFRRKNSNIKDIPLFTHTPNINDIKQGMIGDCWLLSAITAIVKVNPGYIRSMFYDNGNGEVLVRLFNDIGNPIYVKLVKQYEIDVGHNMAATWVQLLEKAYALCNFNNKSIKLKGKYFSNVIDELTGGYVTSDTIKHLVGNNKFKHVDLFKKDAQSKFLKDGENSKNSTEKALRNYYIKDDLINSNKYKELKNKYKNLYTEHELYVYLDIDKTIQSGGAVFI